ncbi:MAG: CpaE family protein [Hyphomicrobiaceae bacterium]
MFSTTEKSGSERLVAAILTPNAELGGRIKTILEGGGPYRGEVVASTLDAVDPANPNVAFAAVHIVDVLGHEPASLFALDSYKSAIPAGRPVIAISEGLFETSARQFLKLGIADWLPTSFEDMDLLLACEQALRLRAAPRAASQSKCIAFMSAVGGAGATTLSLASLLAVAGKKKGFLRQCCAVDLDFQHSSLAEYADIAPALQLSELASDLERLDRHLLEIMLSRHVGGLTLLAAPPALQGPQQVSPQVVGRLLDLVATDFSHVVVDLPSCWQPWFQDIVTGMDEIFIVTEPNVVGLRQAYRLAGMLSELTGTELRLSVIVNKRRRFGASVSARQVQDALGPLFAGFVSDSGTMLRRAQDLGDMLAQLTPRSRILRDVSAVLEARNKVAATALINLKEGGRK